ncbi:hypothetical protein PAXRUDRAFT_583788 [Paxillus rubicundulus Ve08.2h10]|uniref:C3H1-type domain-containing protein n=1 Tax=Paxillus rubicundulus Ve08.2h10 TaxID=930991 RepID=A0A0D0D692_9AGAM|nr:hypothetical protein PAXRUDRAFT_583788 [Paxillus rubicundulus Ve08.2h10]
MTIQKPAWRKRSRPCPFFSQGRCLFADSCNFLHDIKVKSAADESLLDATQVKQQSSLPSKHVFDLPSLVIDSASPLSANLRAPASPVHDSSRYSGLLSVLSDVIGHSPLSPTDEDSASEFQAQPDSTLDFKDIKYSSGVSIPEVDSTSNDLESVGYSPKLQTLETDERGASGYEGASSTTQPSVSETLSYSGGRNLNQDEVPHCKHDNGQPTSGFMPYANNDGDDDDVYPAGDATCYVVEDIEYVVGSVGDEVGGDGEEEMEEDAGNNSTVVAPQRCSVLSSFTGASLLASPRSNVFEKASVQDGASGLLSPVELSARLRPFSIPSLDVTCRRGGSIDSGYADGDGWVGPNPFPGSPPSSARSSMNFLPFQSRRMPLVSPTLHERRVSYDIRATRPSLHLTIDTIEEHTHDESSEDTCSILGAYDTSHPSQGEIEADFASPTLRVSLAVTAEQTVEESGGTAGPSTVLRSHQLDSPQLLHPTGEHEIDLHGQPFFASEDNTTFKTALSTQPSFEHLSDVSGRASPDKQDSLLSSISYCSTPNTSLQSHDDDLPDVLEGCTASPYACDYPHLASSEGQLDSQDDSKEKSSTDCSLPVAIVSDSNALQPSLASKLDFFHESAAQHVGSTRNRWSWSSHSCALTSDLPAELPHGPQFITDARECVVLDADCREDASFRDLSVSEAYGGPEIVVALEVRSPAADHNLGLQEDGNSFDSQYVSVCEGDLLQFPLPPVFLPTELLGHSSVSTDEGMFIRSEVDGVEVPENVTHPWSFTRPEEAHSASDLTVELSPNQIFPTESPDSAVDFISQRSRAASDLTVKGKSSPPATLPEELPATHSKSLASVSSPTIHEQSFRSDSVQSLYDQYMHVASSSDLSPSGCEHGDLEFPTASHHAEQCSLESQLRSPELPVQVFHAPSSLISRTELTDCYSDSSRSQMAFRPLLTGRRSLLNSSLSEFVPKASPTDANERISVSAPSSARLQTRETGSTMVPLGFRRYNPQFAVKQRSAQPLQSVAEPRAVLRIRTDIAEQTSSSRCFSATPFNPSTPRSPSPPQSAPPTSGLKPLRLSSILNHKSTFIRPSDSSIITSSILSPEHTSNSCPVQSPSVSSSASFSRNSLVCR